MREVREREGGEASEQNHAHGCVASRRRAAAQWCVVTRESPARGIVRVRSLCIVYFFQKKFRE
jgi:hypothetical protein